MAQTQSLIPKLKHQIQEVEAMVCVFLGSESLEFGVGEVAAAERVVLLLLTLLVAVLELDSVPEELE